MIPRSALVTIGEIDIAAAEDEQIPKAYQGYVCELRLGSFETGKIMYVNTDTHRTIAKLSVTGMLPFIGLFKTEAYSKDSYIWNDTDMASLPDTVYLLGEDAVHITDVSVEQGQNLLTAEAPTDALEAWKIHLNKGVSDSSWVNLHMTYEDQQSSGTRRDCWLSFNWTDTTPHLYLRDFDGNAWTMDTLHYGETIRTNICFGSGDTTDPVLTASELTSEKGSIVLEQQETRIAVYAEYKDGVTEDAIVYNAPDGKTYRMPFRLALPELGIYRDTSWSASSLVGAQQQTFDQGTKPELYLHWTCNADEIKSISVSGSETSERAEAPTWLYDCVKDVSFRLTGIANMLADGSSVVPGEGEANVTLVQQPNLTLRGKSIPRVRLHADAGKFFCARLELTFTLDLTEFDLGTQSYTVGNGALYVCSGEAHFAIDEKMTAAELNEALSSTENLLAFLQKTDSEAYTAYRLSIANSFTGDYSIILDLPAVEYDKPIVLAADRAVRGGI